MSGAQPPVIEHDWNGELPDTPLQHTPGPWAAFTDGKHTNIVSFVPRTDCVFSLPGHDKNDPNVRLIAAAPELLEALRPFANFACSPSGQCECHNCRARDVIAKATGSASTVECTCVAKDMPFGRCCKASGSAA